MKDAQANKAAELTETELVDLIHKSEISRDIASTTLRTDERVIARVTDGIYRRPGSALRELISNAYDADATRVIIKTDAPRFERITVEDNGHGMSPEALAHLLHHIGGSAKRSKEGSALGVTSAENSSLSPGGRRLIGKIGIGLFSVSQLTHSFEVITKVKGDNFRTIATIVLKQYSDEVTELPKGEKRYESGKVNIWREKAPDINSHGTSIVLTNVRSQAKDTLRSSDVWAAIAQAESTEAGGGSGSIEPPRFHIGHVEDSDQLLKKTGKDYDSLPWNKGDLPEIAFEKLVQCVWDEIGKSSPNPQLERIFDYYLRMVWQLALAVPLPYVDEHIFDIDPSVWDGVFELSNRPKGAAMPVKFGANETIRSQMKMQDMTASIGGFEVYVDDLRLRRPIKFKNLPGCDGALKRPLVFTGKMRETFEKIPRELSGGPLAFEAYLFWTPKIAPTEHQGALVRIHGSSGTLFDPTFMRYQIAENTRMKQVMCEIFVSEGLDSALNIDRESFNSAHPHAVYITKWLHSAFRQLSTAHKKVASEIREKTRGESKVVAVTGIQKVALDVWSEQSGDADSKPPSVEIASTETTQSQQKDAYVFSRSAILPESGKGVTTKQRTHTLLLEEKLKSIAQILASFGLLDAVPKRKQEKLLKAIYKILEAPEE